MAIPANRAVHEFWTRQQEKDTTRVTKNVFNGIHVYPFNLSKMFLVKMIARFLAASFSTCYVAYAGLQAGSRQKIIKIIFFSLKKLRIPGIFKSWAGPGMFPMGL